MEDARFSLRHLAITQQGHVALALQAQEANRVDAALSVLAYHDGSEQLHLAHWPPQIKAPKQGNYRTMIDPRGKTWKREYDSAGNLTATVSPLNHRQSFSYDETGHLETQTDARGHTTTLEYDDRNRLRITRFHDTSFTETVYNGRDQVIQIIDEEQQHRRSMGYDAEGGLQTATDGRGNTIRYDNGIAADSAFSGLLNRVEYPSYSEDYGYDNRDRQTRITRTLTRDDNAVQIQRMSYDAVGNVKTRWDERDRATTYTYDAHDQQISMTDTAQQTTLYEYDARGNLIAVTNARDVVIRRYEYDGNNRRTAEIFPDGARLPTDYDPAGNIAQTLDAKGQVSRYQYDDDGRLLQIDYYADGAAVDAGTAVKTMTFGYDANSSMTAYDDGTTAATYSYDNRDRLTSVTVDFGPFSKSFSYTYYKNGLKKTFTDAENQVFAYFYDANNQLSRIDIPGEGSLTVSAYDWTSPQLITLPGGVVQSFTYDSLMRVERIASTTPTQQTLLDYQYTYDAGR